MSRTGTKIQHPPDTALLRVLVYRDDMVEFTMFRDGQEVGRTTVPKHTLLAMLSGDGEEVEA